MNVHWPEETVTVVVQEHIKKSKKEYMVFA